MEWKLADAKNRFSEVVRRALIDGPQRVSRREEAVVILAEREYQALRGERPDFKAFLMSRGPKAPSLKGVDLKRDNSPMRNVKLVDKPR